MGKRKDGLERRAAVLEAATQVFAEKGYRATTIADICKAARSNTASVNYYFGSKEHLYAEVWKNAFRLAITKYPPDMGVGADASPEERLRAFIRSLLHKMLAGGELGHAGQILLMEVSNPTEALDMVKHDTLEPIRLHLCHILSQLLGPTASEQQIAFCAMSIVHQCIGFGFKKGHLPPIFSPIPIDAMRQQLTEHVTRFSLAGLAAIKEQINHPQLGEKRVH